MDSKTVTGKALNVQVGYRLPVSIYQAAILRARQRGVKLSVVLREATIAGLGGQGERVRANREGRRQSDK